MTLNNSLNDSIIRIKNGYKARKQNIVLNKSNLCIEILKILRNEGYIRGFKIERNSIIVMLKYFQDNPVIKDIILYSPLSIKSTVSFTQLKQLYENKEKKTNGLILNILSTSSGVLSDYTCLKNRLGGKLLLMII
jgi:small subunit ribosomal protein S8